MHSATLFASPAVVVDAPAFGGLAGHARGPERGKKKTADDSRGLAVLELFASDLAEDDAVVLALRPVFGILVAPGKRRGGPRSVRDPPVSDDCRLWRYFTKMVVPMRVARKVTSPSAESHPRRVTFARFQSELISLRDLLR